MEARTSETDGCLQELWTDTGVESTCIGDFIDVSTCDFANCGQGIDGRDSLSQHCVGGLYAKAISAQFSGHLWLIWRNAYKFGEFRRPETGSDTLLPWYPVGIDVYKSSLSSQTFRSAKRADEYTVRLHQIADCGSFSQKLGVGENVEAAVWAGVGFKDGSHGLRSAAWDGGLLDDDLG